MNTPLDFVAIGDITIDAFILLKEAETHCEINSETCTICMRFADKIPYERVEVIPAVGNSPNAASAAHRLGLRTALVTNIGDDRNGRDCLDELARQGISTEYVSVQAGRETNYHYVLSYGSDRTILIRQLPFDYSLPDFAMPPRWLYLSSVGEDTLFFHGRIAAYLREHPETKLAFQPGTYQMKFGHEALKDIYAQTDLFFCNKEEAKRVLGMGEGDVDIKVLLAGIRALGPEYVFVTDGPQGAYALIDGENYYLPIYPDPAPPTQRTGAGDAFASTVTAAIALGYSPLEALVWGPVNSMNVVQHIGAQKGLLSRQELEKYLANAPAGYRVQKL